VEMGREKNKFEWGPPKLTPFTTSWGVSFLGVLVQTNTHEWIFSVSFVLVCFKLTLKAFHGHLWSSTIYL
jgi:hypothetical protein